MFTKRVEYLFFDLFRHSILSVVSCRMKRAETDAFSRLNELQEWDFMNKGLCYLDGSYRPSLRKSIKTAKSNMLAASSVSRNQNAEITCISAMHPTAYRNKSVSPSVPTNTLATTQSNQCQCHNINKQTNEKLNLIISSHVYYKVVVTEALSSFPVRDS